MSNEVHSNSIKHLFGDFYLVSCTRCGEIGVFKKLKTKDLVGATVIVYESQAYEFYDNFDEFKINSN